MLNVLREKFIREYPTHFDYVRRLKEEFHIIEEKGFTETYLQVWNIIQLIKRRGSLWLLRGSGASSLVAYYMGIHDIDPIKENIPLERFLNWTREDQPDFDIDVPYDVRDTILSDVGEVYPRMVSRISNRVKYTEKSALREAIRVNGYRKFVPKYFRLEKIFPNPSDQQKVKETAKELLGKQRMWSKHCGGIVIWKDGIPENLILKENQIAVDKYDVEENNWIKIDLLCNRGLAQLRELDPYTKLSEYPFDDKTTSELLCRGDVLGLTQSESRTMRKTILAIQPKTMYDVALALALIRPAAADGGRKASYFRDGKAMFVYDEDALTFIASAVGCSLSQADRYRRGFANLRKDVMDEFKQKCKEQSVLKELSHLRKYSFAKGHSIAYGQMVWALAYHKARNSKRFWEATLKHNQSSYKKWVHKREAILNGVNLRNETDGSIYDQYTKSGWWDGSDFFPKMMSGEVDGQYYFNGLVANFRKLNRYGRSCVLMTVGVGNGEYLDLVINKKYPFGYYGCIEGWGYKKEEFNSSFIEVVDFKPYNLRGSTAHKLQEFFC
jgi:DNA polymerase III alpha subunit